uniref:Small ribosomal subunit protein uS3c n=1 Tax=Euglena mutabilis TaxID=38275 RepID=A0A1B0UL01_EUGMU|nr:ribosomal protein S3 [Euglena mutabilis]
MGQKVHPEGFRIGVSQEHKAFWYSKTNEYFKKVKEDILIRDFIKNKLTDSFISDVIIKKKSTSLVINIYVLKPSEIIGIDGSKLYELRNELSKKLSTSFTSENVVINIVQVNRPDSNARILSELARQQLEKRVPFRRVMKNIMAKAQKAGVRGIKIQIAGRLNGAEIARTEWVKEGQVPLHTLKANIDYCSYKAQTIYGIIGIKIWVYKIS